MTSLKWLLNYILLYYAIKIQSFPYFFTFIKMSIVLESFLCYQKFKSTFATCDIVKNNTMMYKTYFAQVFVFMVLSHVFAMTKFISPKTLNLYHGGKKNHS